MLFTETLFRLPRGCLAFSTVVWGKSIVARWKPLCLGKDFCRANSIIYYFDYLHLNPLFEREKLSCLKSNTKGMSKLTGNYYWLED